MIYSRASRYCSLLVATGVACVGLSPGRLSAEPASSADRFVDAMGVNTHLKFTNGPNSYASAQILTLLGQLGLRHIRDDMQVGNSAYSRLTSLYNSYGIRVNWVPYTWERTAPTAAQLVSSLKSNAFFEAIEGPNEPDAIPAPISYNGFTDNPAGNNYAGTRAWQNDMFTGVKGDPLTSATLMFSPGMAFSVNAQYLAPISLDYEAMHSYPGGKNPVNNLDIFNISNVNLMITPSKPIVATETGYHTATNDTSTHPYVSQRAQGKYLPRLFAEYFNRGIRTTYLYEFVDEGTDSANKEDNFGLVNYNLTPKPAFTNLQNLITLLKEGNWDTNNKVWNVPGFTPTALDYTLAGSTNNVHHTLLQKSTGEFFLLLWQEVSTFYNNGGAGNIANWKDITNATVPVTLTLNTPITSAATYLLGSLTPTATYANPSSLSLSVPDEVLVVRLVSSPLSAAFSGSPTNGSVALSVSFADSSTGLITNRFWNFGDGSTTNTTAINVSHLYTNVGTYTVSLVVRGSSGSSTNTRVNYIVVGSPPSSLLAQWNFSTGTAADLISDNGVYTFTVAGVGTPTYHAGSISLADGTELVATGINSTARPALATNATVWVRMKFDSMPIQNPVFFFGLVKATVPADWGQMSMAGIYADWGGGSQIGQYANTTTGSYGQLFVAPPATNTSFTMALVLSAGFDQNSFPNATLTRFQTYVNRVSVGSGSGTGTNVNSLAFALGTLKASGGAGYTFDEARVYDQALTAAQIAQIDAPVPPAPVFTSMVRSGSALVLSGTNGAANGIYQVLSSTNAALPLAEWTPILTNTFDAGGGFVVTNIIDPMKPANFLLIMQ